jgi:ion channel-forming bestrophin family protein
MLLNQRIPLRYVINDVRVPLIIITVLSLSLEYLTSVFQHLLPDMPLTIPVFLGTAISIILSFKLSQSYDRWWEARKIWGSIVNDSRTLIISSARLQNKTRITS